MKYIILALLFVLLAFYVVREDQTIPIEMEIKNVAANLLKNASSGEIQTLESFWKNETCVIIFLRRWGCAFCRLWATDLKEIAPTLKQNNVRLIGVGPEEIGVEDFIKGKYFDGDLYIDTNKQTYNGLGFKRFNYLSVIASLFTSQARGEIARSREKQVGGDFKGDGLQNGGALIIEKGGKMLYSFRQEGPAEHISNAKILEVLGLGPAAGDVTKIEKIEKKCKDTCEIP